MLAQAETSLRIADRLAAVIPDHRDPTRVRHCLPDILRARILAIAAGYADADDLDALRRDPTFMMALGRAPGDKLGLASQPTMSPASAPTLRTLITLTYEMIDIYCDSHATAPGSITLNIDAAHGAQQLTFWNGFHGERG